MQTRLISCLLLASCYSGSTEDAAGSERAERAPRVVFSSREATAGSASCASGPCISTLSKARGGARRVTNVRNVRVATGEAEGPRLNITVELPITLVDCSQVQLSIVGPWHAALGDSIVLEALASGTDDQPTLTWQMMGGEVTVLGPLTAAVRCIEPGAHIVSVAFAPPAPCPSTLQVEIDCDAPPEP